MYLHSSFPSSFNTSPKTTRSTLDPTCRSVISVDFFRTITATYLFPNTIDSDIRADRGNPLGNSLEAIHEFAFTLVRNLVLRAQVVGIDKVAILIDELAVGIRASVFDLRRVSVRASERQRRDLQLPSEYQPREGEAVAEGDGSCVLQLVASEGPIDHSWEHQTTMSCTTGNQHNITENLNADLLSQIQLVLPIRNGLDEPGQPAIDNRLSEKREPEGETGDPVPYPGWDNGSGEEQGPKDGAGEFEARNVGRVWPRRGEGAARR